MVDMTEHTMMFTLNGEILLMIQVQNWLSRTLMLVMVSVLRLVLPTLGIQELLVLMPLYQPSQFEGEQANELGSCKP